MSDIQINSSKDIDTARQALFGGDLFIYGQLPSVKALCSFADELICETFGDLQPQKAQFDLPVEQFVEKVGPLKSHFTNHRRPSLLPLLSSVIITLWRSTRRWRNCIQFCKRVPARFCRSLVSGI